MKESNMHFRSMRYLQFEIIRKKDNQIVSKLGCEAVLNETHTVF